jgi:hypothetical protein
MAAPASRGVAPDPAAVDVPAAAVRPGGVAPDPFAVDVPATAGCPSGGVGTEALAADDSGDPTRTPGEGADGAGDAVGGLEVLGLGPAVESPAGAPASAEPGVDTSPCRDVSAAPGAEPGPSPPGDGAAWAGVVCAAVCPSPGRSLSCLPAPFSAARGGSPCGSVDGLAAWSSVTTGRSGSSGVRVVSFTR